MEKKALGRGLDALLPTGRTTAEPERGDVQELRLEAIVPNRFQPRQQFSEVELAELTASLKQNGLLQPILVRRKGDGIYELIAGERRLRAAKLAGMQKIPALVRNVSDQESMVLALVEKDVYKRQASDWYLMRCTGSWRRSGLLLNGKFSASRKPGRK